MAVQSVSFGESEKRKSGSALPIVGAGAGALVGGLAIGRPKNGMDVLKEDKFELSKKHQDGLTPEEKDAIRTIQEEKATKFNVDEYLNSLYKFDETGAVDVKTVLGKTPDELKAALDARKNDTKPIEEFKAAEAALEKADEAGKEAAKVAFDAKKAALEIHTSQINTDEALLKLAGQAKDGKLTKEMLKAYEIDKHTLASIMKIDKALEILGKKVGKKFAGGKAALGAGIGLIGGWILSKIFAPKENA